MKKLILLTLVAIVPFLTMAQKRTKKGTDIEEKTKEKSSNTQSNFMIIKAVEVDMSQEGMDQEEKEVNDVSLDRLMKRHIKPMSRFYFSYDVGAFNEEVQKLTAASIEFRSIAQAVNQAKEYGWEFINATIVIDGSVKIHYYFMKR